MNSSAPATDTARSRRPPDDLWPAAVLAGVLLLLAGGCSDWSYDRIQIGMTQQQCALLFTEDSVRRTELGFCRLTEDRRGQTDALVVLLSRDGQVAGKLQATLRARDRWIRVERVFRLRGEVDPGLADLQATGPIDMLRVVTDDLSGYRGAQTAQQAHAWVAAGLARLMERWPHVASADELCPQLTETLERVPGGGTARIEVDRRGVYCFEYRQQTGR